MRVLSVHEGGVRSPSGRPECPSEESSGTAS